MILGFKAPKLHLDYEADGSGWLRIHLASSEALTCAEISTYGRFRLSPRTFLHYVDDCFCVLPKDSLQFFTAHLNGKEPAIQFMTREEADGCLAFLDVLMKRDGVGWSFTVFRKKDSHRLVPTLYSVHPATQKWSATQDLQQDRRQGGGRYESTLRTVIVRLP